MPETKGSTEIQQKAAQHETQKRRPVRTFFKSFVDVRRWVSYDELAANTKNTLSLFRRLIFRSKGEVRHETYEDAVARLGMSEEQLVVRKKNFLYSAFIYCAFGLGLLIYFFYLLVNVRLLASLVSLVLVILMALATYREHFWYMQMQKKKLGCTFRDWVAFISGRSK